MHKLNTEMSLLRTAASHPNITHTLILFSSIYLFVCVRVSLSLNAQKLPERRLSYT